MLDTVADLRFLANREKEFEKVLPQGQIRALIISALNKESSGEILKEQPTKKDKEKPVVVDEPCPPTQPTSDPPVSKLPPGVRFHYFASHKKQHSRFGRDSASEPSFASRSLHRSNHIYSFVGVAGAQVQGFAQIQVQLGRLVRRCVCNLTLCRFVWLTF